MRNKILGTMMLLALAACGSEDAFTPAPGGGGPGGPPPPPPEAVSLVLTSSAASIPADGSVPAEVRALLLDSNNVVVPGVPVAFSADSGALNVTSPLTGENGVALATLSTGGNSASRNIVVTAVAGGLSRSVTVAVGAASSGATPATLTLTSSVASLPTDGSVTASIRALVLDSNNVVASGIPVSFQADSGALSAGLVNTDNNGYASVTLTTGGDPTARSIAISASVDGIGSENLGIAVSDSASGAMPERLILTTDVGTIPLDGSRRATITARVLDENNVAVQGVPVQFSSLGSGAGVAPGGALSGGIVSTNSAGEAVVSLSTAGDSTPRTVTVFARIQGELEESLDVHVGGGAANTPAFLTVTPSVQTIPTSGSVNATITAIVVDENQVVVPGVPVAFSSQGPSAGTGGALSAGLVNTDSSGRATVTLAEGGVGSVRSIDVSVTVQGLPSEVVRVNVGDTSGVTPAALIVTSSVASLPVDGSQSATITARVLDSNFVAMQGVPVRFASTGTGTSDGRGGALSAGLVSTNAAGEATVTLGTAGDPTARVVTVTAEVDELPSQLVQVQVGGTAAGLTPASLSVTPATQAIAVDGSTTASIRALVVDANQIVVPGVEVTFAADSGALSAGSVMTGANGEAVVTVSEGGVGVPRTINVAVAVSGLPSRVVMVNVGGAASAQPDRVMLTTNLSAIEAGGSQIAELTALVVDANNAAMPGVPVTFSSVGSTGTGGALSAGVVSTDSNGLATVNLSIGNDHTPRDITVTATAGAVSNSVTVAVGTGVTEAVPVELHLVRGVLTVVDGELRYYPIYAIVTDANGVGVTGVVVRFSVNDETQGSILSGTVVTGSMPTDGGVQQDGVAQTRLYGVSGPSNVVINAEIGPVGTPTLSATLPVTFP